MTREKLLKMVGEAEGLGLVCKYYPNNYLINITDTDGVIQSFYASTGTAIFRDGNNKFNSKMHTEYNMKYERFLSLCKGEEDILETFFE